MKFIALLLLFVAGNAVDVTTSLQFPSQPVGTTSNTKFAVVTNNDTATDFSFDNTVHFQVTGDFAVDLDAANQCDPNKVVKPEQWCAVGIRFTPSAQGPRTGKLRMRSKAGAVYEVSLSGVGGASEF